MKIRIAFAVDSKGNWNTAGYESGDEEELMEDAVDSLEGAVDQYWIEAEIALPKPLIVSGTIKKLKENERWKRVR